MNLASTARSNGGAARRPLPRWWRHRLAAPAPLILAAVSVRGLHLQYPRRGVRLQDSADRLADPVGLDLNSPARRVPQTGGALELSGAGEPLPAFAPRWSRSDVDRSSRRASRWPL